MIPIFRPYMPPGVISDLEKILYSGTLAYDEYGKLFEEGLINYTGSRYVLTVSSYNFALLIVLSTLGFKPGDEIIASPVSCLASNQPFAVKGLKVVWADVEPTSGAMSVDDVKSKISNRTKAIFHNHYCGYLGHIDEINALGREYGIPVIDDCIEAFGSELNDKKTGNIGSDITVFSFQTVRLPNTIDGGAIVFNKKEIFEKARLIRDYGIDRTKFRNDQNEINSNYNIELEGYGALMSEINSLIGLKQIKLIEGLIKKQRSNAKRWTEILEGNKDFRPLQCTTGSSPNYWIFGLLATNKASAIDRFRKEGFYATGVHINNNIYSIFGSREDLPGVNEFIKRFVALPSGWWIESEQIELRNGN